MRRFLRDTKGSVLVEFSFTIPILATLVLSILEVGNYLLLHTKLQHAAVTMADLATREENISEQVVDDLFSAVPQILAPFEMGDDGVVILSAVGREGTDPPEVLWQRRGAGPLNDVSFLGVTGSAAATPAGIAVAPDETVVIAELIYDYEPIAFDLFSAERIIKTSFFRPRLGSLQVVDP